MTFIPPEIIEAAKAFLVMMVNGTFSALGAAVSYFYHIDKNEIAVSLKKLLTWVCMGWAVGAGVGEFIEYAPTWASEHLYGALFVAGVFWRNVWEITQERILSVTGSRQ